MNLGGAHARSSRNIVIIKGSAFTAARKRGRFGARREKFAKLAEDKNPTGGGKNAGDEYKMS